MTACGWARCFLQLAHTLHIWSGNKRYIYKSHGIHSALYSLVPMRRQYSCSGQKVAQRSASRTPRGSRESALQAPQQLFLLSPTHRNRFTNRFLNKKKVLLNCRPIFIKSIGECISLPLQVSCLGNIYPLVVYLPTSLSAHVFCTRLGVFKSSRACRQDGNVKWLLFLV